MKPRIKEVLNTYLKLRERYDDRPDNWKELPGYNPDYFYDDEWEKLKTMDDGDEEAWLERMRRKLSGVNDEQAAYNKRNGLPPTWRGSKEGYHEYITNKDFPSGSNE